MLPRPQARFGQAAALEAPSLDLNLRDARAREAEDTTRAMGFVRVAHCDRGIGRNQDTISRKIHPPA